MMTGKSVRGKLSSQRGRKKRQREILRVQRYNESTQEERINEVGTVVH